MAEELRVATGPDDVVRIRLDLAYDGTGFAGWAAQPAQRTVQGVLDAALASVLRLPGATTVVAGRTDAGVHALGQVCHTDVPAANLEAVRGRSAGTAEQSLRTRLAGVLPPDVVVVAAIRAPTGFDARFSALSRQYAYHLDDSGAGVLPLRRHDVVAVRGRLDVEAMSAATAGLLGVHDFAAYCRRRDGASTVRGLQRLDVERDAPQGDDPRQHPAEPAAGLPPSPASGPVTVTVVADAFCHSMVRTLVGALLDVGRGRRDPDWPARVLRAAVRDPSVTVAPARGLVLQRVRYPAPQMLAARAAESRVRRDVPRDVPGDVPGAAGAPAGPAGVLAGDAGTGSWDAAGMTQTPTTPADDGRPVPVGAETSDHDGVLEMADTDDDRYTDSLLDQGYSPMERERHVGRHGLTPDEDRLGEPLDERLAQEEPDAALESIGADVDAGGSAELTADLDTDGELLDDEVGAQRAGRLVDPDQGGGPDTEASMVATDAGVSGGAASAEEAAMHVVPDGGDGADDRI